MQQRENMIYQRAIANCDWIGTSRKVTATVNVKMNTTWKVTRHQSKKKYHKDTLTKGEHDLSKGNRVSQTVIGYRRNIMESHALL